MLGRGRFFASSVAVRSVAALCIALGTCSAAVGQEPRQLVEQTVQVELNASANDHTHWLYFEVDRRPENSFEQWVAETHAGDLERTLGRNGRALSPEEQRSKMESIIHDPDAQAKKQKANEHDQRQAVEFMKMLPQAFVWTISGNQDGGTTLHYKPDPQFQATSLESRALAAMEGEMTIDNAEHRIVCLKGKLTHDVRFAGGFFGVLNAGGSFDVERGKVGKGNWQIMETHVHLRGHALIFKTISEQEDDVRNKFEQLPENVTLEQAEQKLLAMQASGTDVASSHQ